MDDDLMRLFGGENMKNLMAKIGMKPGEPLNHPWLNTSIEKAQKKVEDRNFEIRKHLLEYDDVLNQQRKFIYEQRDAILSDADLRKRVNDATADMIRGAVAEYQQSLKRNAAGALKVLGDFLKLKFGYVLQLEPGQDQHPEIFEKQIAADLEKDLADKAALVSDAALNEFIRMQYLAAVDRRWLDHLENMTALREAVYLRSYAQKNPLTEYKVEGFQIFDTMVDQIREEIASRLHLIRFRLAEKREGPRTRPTQTVQSTSHGAASAFAGQRGGGTDARSQGGAVTVVRSTPKVGRNDPCPCGSGKKYKYCHGQ
jgi:preprotein translocase subunit SecA